MVYYEFFMLSSIQGMDFTTDKLRSLVRKWQTLIEAHVDVKTTDNYTLRMFCIGFTRRRSNQVKRTCYAQSSQIRQVNYLLLVCISLGSAFCDLYFVCIVVANKKLCLLHGKTWYNSVCRDLHSLGWRCWVYK